MYDVTYKSGPLYQLCEFLYFGNVAFVARFLKTNKRAAALWLKFKILYQMGNPSLINETDLFFVIHTSCYLIILK